MKDTTSKQYIKPKGLLIMSTNSVLKKMGSNEKYHTQHRAHRTPLNHSIPHNTAHTAHQSERSTSNHKSC